MGRLLSVAPAMRLASTSRMMSTHTTATIAAAKANAAAAEKLLPFLDAALKPWAESQTQHLKDVEMWASKYPAVTEEICKRKAANPLAAGIVATTAESRAPSTCKYTVEGTLIHNVMKKFYQDARFETFILDGIEITFTPEDKADMQAQMDSMSSELHTRMVGVIRSELAPVMPATDPSMAKTKPPAEMYPGYSGPSMETFLKTPPTSGKDHLEEQLKELEPMKMEFPDKMPVSAVL